MSLKDMEQEGLHVIPPPKRSLTLAFDSVLQ